MKLERTRLFRSVDNLPRRDLLEEFADAFTPPEDLLLDCPDPDVAGHVLDGEHIAGYFRKAIGDLRVAGMLSDETEK